VSRLAARGGFVVVVFILGLVYFSFRRTPTGGVEFALGELGRWREVDAREDELLRDGAFLALWRLEGISSHPPMSVVLREGPICRAIRSVADLAHVVRPIDTGEKAIRYSELLRLFEIDEAQVPGQALARNPPGKTTTGRGFFSDADALNWGITECPSASAESDGFHRVRRPVFVEGGCAASLGMGALAVVLVLERIGPRGEYSFSIERILESMPGASLYREPDVRNPLRKPLSVRGTAR
jgi:hypothetical protein